MRAPEPRPDITAIRWDARRVAHDPLLAAHALAICNYVEQLEGLLESITDTARALADRIDAVDQWRGPHQLPDRGFPLLMRSAPALVVYTYINDDSPLLLRPRFLMIGRYNYVEKQWTEGNGDMPIRNVLVWQPAPPIPWNTELMALIGKEIGAA